MLSHDFPHKAKFTKAGENLVTKMFDEGKPMNCIPGCTVKICVIGGILGVSVYCGGVKIGGFEEVDATMDTTYTLPGVSMQLEMNFS